MKCGILVIDDQAAIQTLVKKILQPKKMTLHSMASDIFDEDTLEQRKITYQVDTVSQGKEGLKLVEQALENNDPYPVAFIDMRMPPGWDGVTTAHRIRKIDPDIQIVFMTAYSDKSMNEIYEQLGGTDKLLYIKKPFDMEEITSITETLVQGYYREIALKKLATRDGLTGLINRQHFLELLEKELMRAKRYSNPLSLLMLDIDHFKKLNDTHGHTAGDKGLEKVASMCADSLRSIDICGRYGGEEFIVMLPESNIQSALETAGRLRKNIEELKIPWKSTELSVTVSIGCAEYDSKRKDTVESLIERADKRLYQAKEEGRNRVVYVET